MGRKIYMTEEQVNEIIDKLNEDNAPINVDATPDVTAAGGNASVGMKKAKDRLRTNGFGNKDANITCDADAIMECGKPFTKKDIKARKLKQLKESSVCYSKKEFKDKVNEKCNL